MRKMYRYPLTTIIRSKNKHQEYILQLKRFRILLKHNWWKLSLKTLQKLHLYRNKRSQKRESDIFEKRVNLKPYEYPHLYEYVPAIRHSYWIHSEFNFTSDIQDFKSRLSDSERSNQKYNEGNISNWSCCKVFWGDLYHRIPNQKLVQ